MCASVLQQRSARVHVEGWGGKGEDESRKRGRKLLGPVGYGLESMPNWPPDHITHMSSDCVSVVLI